MGSICSGSGAGELGLNLLALFLQDLSPAILLGAIGKPIFFCESNPQKVDWLTKNFKAACIFKDASLMGETRTHDWVTGTSQDIPPVDILTAGFSCKDLSSLNAKKTELLKEIQRVLVSFLNMTEKEIMAYAKTNDASTTALTLGGVLRYLYKHNPSLALLENVPEFLKIIDTVKELLARRGYMCVHVSSCPSTLGFPIARHRVYMGCKHDPGNVYLALLDNEFNTVFRKLHAELCCQLSKCPAIPLQSFLLSTNGMGVDFWMKANGWTSASTSSQSGADALWMDQHKVAFQELRMLRPSETALKTFIRTVTVGMPNKEVHEQMFFSMPLRQQEYVFLLHAKAFQDTPPTMPLGKDVSQGLGRASNGIEKLGCLTGSCDHWLFEAPAVKGSGKVKLWRRF
jgi:site-specific DNA-cytosine methylase